MEIDPAPLRNALARLEEGLARHLRDPADAQLRDGLIQRFEFTYELVHKTLRRYLVSMSPTPEEDGMPTFPDLIRLGNRHGLLRSDWAVWRGYREMRGRTSHAYNEDMALAVVNAIPDFVEEARFLRDALVRRLA